MGCDGFEVESREAVGIVLLSLEEDDFLLADFADQAVAVLSGVTLVEAIAPDALGVAVELGESERHVLAVDVVAAVGLFDGEQPAA